MVNLNNIRKAVSLYPAFKDVVTEEKLKSSGGRKTVTQAKEVGVFLAHIDGHDEKDIAKTFGYASDKSVSNIFRKAALDFKNDALFSYAVENIAQKLEISLE